VFCIPCSRNENVGREEKARLGGKKEKRTEGVPNQRWGEKRQIGPAISEGVEVGNIKPDIGGRKKERGARA